MKISIDFWKQQITVPSCRLTLTPDILNIFNLYPGFEVICVCDIEPKKVDYDLDHLIMSDTLSVAEK